MSHSQPPRSSQPSRHYDAVVVGAGFAGLYMLHRLRTLGLEVRVFEAGDGIGGTWFWNRYPGARCDIQSIEYCYQFDPQLQREWEWTERYASQPEILDYIHHVADRFDLHDDIRLSTRVDSAHYDERSERWRVCTDRGDEVSADFCIMATGCLSVPNRPDIDGLEDFAGPVYHTGRWPKDGVDFTGRRVAVIGTGSSGIQAIPLIAREAAQLTVFQRTPNYSVPAHNRPLDPDRVAEVKAHYRAFREDNAKTPFGADFFINEQAALAVSEEERERIYEARWAHGGLPFMGAFSDLLYDKAANDTARDFISRKIAAKVEDPELAAKLTPDSVVACKRLCVDGDYYETYNKDHVELVDVRETPIVAVTPGTVLTSAAEYPVDTIVLATGFDAMTGALTRIDVRGRDGRGLAEKWSAGPRSYLGLSVAGFPNLFLITGPGSPSVLSNMLPSIEQHVEWIADCLAHLQQQGKRRIEATEEAEDGWVERVNAIAGATLYPSCNSWYLGANVPGKARVFMPYLGFDSYVEECEAVVSAGYRGFTLS